MQKGVKVLLVFIVLVLSMLQAIFMLNESAHFSGKIQTYAVSGSISMCMNRPANFTSFCAEFINQSTVLEDNTYRCQLNGTSGSTYSLNYTYMPFTINGLNFSMNSSGAVVIQADHSGVGRYLVPLTLKDTSPCPMPHVYNYYFNITDINDPPTLTRLLPSKDIKEGDTIVPFFLSDHFMDVDNDIITYTVSSTPFVIVIDPITSRVSITAPGGFCEKDHIYFTATDEHNLSTSSNVVTLDEKCEQPPGGGGGGGGGSRQCESEWSCRDWSKCYINGTQFRTCVDLNGCDLDELKKDFWRECTYVPTCYDGVQNQGETGIDCGGPCSACLQEVVPPQEKEPSCNDGIKNQGETGIDCGGPCPVCKQIEVPGLLPESKANDLLTTVMIIIFSAGAFALIYAIFRKEIKTLYAKIVWWFTKYKLKQILITNLQKDELLELLLVLDSKVRKASATLKSSDKTFQEAMRINRVYMNYALKSHSFYEDELERAMSKIVNNDLKRALRMFVKRQTILETTNQTITKENLLYYIQELRQLILNTSIYDRKDYSFTATQMPLSPRPLEKSHALLYNTMVALEFQRVDVAKQFYIEILKVYETLNEQEKTSIYYELSKTFSYVRYVLSWTKDK